MAPDTVRSTSQNMVVFGPQTNSMHTVFSRDFFTGWVVVLFIWAFFAAIIITCTPIIESWKGLVSFFEFVSGFKQSHRKDNEVHHLQFMTDRNMGSVVTGDQKGRKT